MTKYFAACSSICLDGTRKGFHSSIIGMLMQCRHLLQHRSRLSEKRLLVDTLSWEPLKDPPVLHEMGHV